MEMGMSAEYSRSPLSVNVFTVPGRACVGDRPYPFGPPPGWDPTTSTLLYGERNAVLIDPQTTVAEAEAVVSWVKLHDRNLETVSITHGHGDRYFGLSVILQHFPDARAIAAPGSVHLLAATEAEFRDQFESQYPGGLPTHIVCPESYPEDTFTLEGQEIRIIE